MEEVGLELVPRPTDKCIQNMIPMERLAEILEAADCDLQEGLAIAQEPPDLARQKIADGKAAEVWATFIWRDGSGEAKLDMKRGDLRFCRAAVVNNLAGGFPQLILQEEPGLTSSVVGHIIVETFNGIVVVRWNAGVDGEKFWELLPSSISKGELASEDAELIAIIYANHQRLGGPPNSRLGAGMAVYEVKLPKLPEIKQDNPEWEEQEYTDEDRPLGYKTHMSITEFLKISDDCRSGFALMKVLLGRSIENANKAMEFLE